MLKRVNSMYFNNLDMAMDFVRHLNELSLQDNKYYNNIHMYAEESAFIVEWTQLPYSREWGGSFEYVDEDQIIMTEKMLPDHTYVYVHDENEWNEMLDEWLKDNPGWEINSFGVWHYKGEE